MNAFPTPDHVCDAGTHHRDASLPACAQAESKRERDRRKIDAARASFVRDHREIIVALAKR